MTPGLSNRSQQRGVALVAAIFLLVVLAGIAGYAVRIGVMQQQTVTAALRAAQAFHAARSGVAWAAHQALTGAWCTTPADAATLNLSEAGTNGFDVAVQCTHTSHAEGGATLDIYVIDVLAEAGAYGGPDYVSRRLQAKVMDGA
jgi:MSHA biogenesis protein MshP